MINYYNLYIKNLNIKYNVVYDIQFLPKRITNISSILKNNITRSIYKIIAPII